MTFDKLVTGDEYLRECQRAARGEIVIEQIVAMKNCAHHWRITGRECSPEERRHLLVAGEARGPVGTKRGSAFTNKQSVFKL